MHLNVFAIEFYSFAKCLDSLKNVSATYSSRDLHNEHCKSSNSKRFKDGNPVNDSTILEGENRREGDERLSEKISNRNLT